MYTACKVQVLLYNRHNTFTYLKLITLLIIKLVENVSKIVFKKSSLK